MQTASPEPAIPLQGPLAPVLLPHPRRHFRASSRYASTIVLPDLGRVRHAASGTQSARDSSPLPSPRRLLNLLVAAVGLVVLSPLMLVIAVAVRLSSPGPVLYRQVRVGRDWRRRPRGGELYESHRDLGGRPFTMYKFRTMRVAAEPGAQWATRDDPRVTPVGRVLRCFRLDELPQFWNVLRGEMNIVGPRPEQPGIAQSLRDQVPRYARRHRLLPGITGWAQINHHYDESLADVERKLTYDLEYLERASLLEDLRIMLRTVPVMLHRRGGW